MRVAQISKLVDRISLREILGPINESYSSNFKPNSNSNKDADTFVPIHKAIEQNFERGGRSLRDIYQKQANENCQIKENDPNIKKVSGSSY